MLENVDPLRLEIRNAEGVELPKLPNRVEHGSDSGGQKVGIGDDLKQGHSRQKYEPSSEQIFHARILAISCAGRLTKLRIGALQQRKAPAGTGALHSFP